MSEQLTFYKTFAEHDESYSGIGTRLTIWYEIKNIKMMKLKHFAYLMDF